MADRDRFGGSDRDYLPGAEAKPWNQNFRWNRGPSTTVPEGFNDPDRFGRMRPEQANNPYAGRINNNPMGGANIGGGWNQYEGAPERGWDYFNLEHATPMSYAEEDMSYMSPNPFPYPGQPWPPEGRPPWGGPDGTEWVGQPGGGEGEYEFAANSPEWTIWNSIRRKYGADAANRLTQNVNRGGIMGLI